MDELLERVLHHLEGIETFTQEWQTEDGVKLIERSTFGPERWIESVVERRVLTGFDFLTVIFFALFDFHLGPTREHHLALVEDWASELHRAAVAGEFPARKPFTLIPINTIPDELQQWCLALSDADQFLTVRGMGWTCSERVEHIYRECLPNIELLRFPPELFPTNADPVGAVTVETTVERQDRRLNACIAAGLIMDSRALQRLPSGIAAVAQAEGVSRQTFTADVKAALQRRLEANREGR